MTYTYHITLLFLWTMFLSLRQGRAFCSRPRGPNIITRNHHHLKMSTTESSSRVTEKETKSALERLLKQQKAELAETERLLQLLDSATNGETQKIMTMNNNGDTNNEATLSMAASILSGADYGFVSRSEGAPSNLKSGLSAADGLAYGGPPANLWSLGSRQFMRNLQAMKGEYTDEEEEGVILTPQQEELQAKLLQLKLNSTEIWERELAHGPIVAPWIIKAPYLLVCYLLDVVFEGRYVPSRFFLLETVARMPYFSYITMLHLYETLGFWRRSADMKRVHFAEEINEYRHLLIMESLGGDQRYWVRFVAQHSAIVYYVILCLLWAVSPSLSYRFSELLETHAVNTYGVFLDDNEELLKELPPSLAAVEYYSFGASDPFYAEFQTSAMTSGADIRRPGVQMKSLYDVFRAIQADEADHVKTMQACLDPDVNLRSPSMEKKILTGVALLGVVSLVLSSGGGFPTDLVTSDTLVDSSAVTAGDASATALVDAALAGAAGVAQKLVQDEEEGGLLGVGTDLMEAGAVMEVVRRGFVSAVEALARFLPFL